MTNCPGASIGLTDVDVVALTLHHEASGEGVRGMTAVGCVIRNRAAWGKWGPSMRDVCLAWKQYSCWRPAGGTTNYGRLAQHADAIRAGRRPVEMAKAYEVAGASAVAHAAACAAGDSRLSRDIRGDGRARGAEDEMIPDQGRDKWAARLRRASRGTQTRGRSGDADRFRDVWLPFVVCGSCFYSDMESTA